MTKLDPSRAAVDPAGGRLHFDPRATPDNLAAVHPRATANAAEALRQAGYDVQPGGRANSHMLHVSLLGTHRLSLSAPQSLDQGWQARIHRGATPPSNSYDEAFSKRVPYGSSSEEEWGAHTDIVGAVRGLLRQPEVVRALANDRTAMRLEGG